MQVCTTFISSILKHTILHTQTQIFFAAGCRVCWSTRNPGAIALLQSLRWNLYALRGGQCSLYYRTHCCRPMSCRSRLRTSHAQPGEVYASLLSPSRTFIATYSTAIARLVSPQSQCLGPLRVRGYLGATWLRALRRALPS